MDFKIVEKGVTVEVKDKDGKAITNSYVGAGWDVSGSGTDLDLVAACLDANGKLTSDTRLVYFGDKTEPGVQLSADNTTGAGDGDDENITFDFSQVEADVQTIAVGIAAYRGADLSTAKNVHFRVVDGKSANDNQVFDVKMEQAKTGDTVLHAFNFKRTAAGWQIENVSKYYAAGSGTAAIQGFAKLFA